LEVYNEQQEYPMSSHTFTKCLKKYCFYKGYKYEEKNAGSVFRFKITDPNRPIVLDVNEPIETNGEADV